jgi:hypothetical protein
MENMKTTRTALQTITIIDLRNPREPKAQVVRAENIRIHSDGFVFQASWKFPVPACMRRYFVGGRQIVVEELGKIPRKSTFQFSAYFV